MMMSLKRCRAATTWAVRRGCVSPRWLSLSLKNASLPTPTDPPQRFLELSNQRRVSIMDAGSGRLGDVLCVVRPYHHLTSPYVEHAANSGVGRIYTRHDGLLMCVPWQHGCPGSVFDFRYLGGELERAGFRVIRVDLPGNTRTPLQVFCREPFCLLSCKGACQNLVQVFGSPSWGLGV
jgi:hypothetical protein